MSTAPKTIQEAIKRGNNLLAAGFLSILGIGLVERAVSEDEWIDRLDDIVIVVLGLAALVWYLRRDSRYVRSLVPLALTAVAFLATAAATVIEFGDSQGAVGNDIGVLVPLLLMLMVVAQSVLLRRSSRPEQLPPPAALDSAESHTPHDTISMGQEQ